MVRRRYSRTEANLTSGPNRIVGIISDLLKLCRQQTLTSMIMAQPRVPGNNIPMVQHADPSCSQTVS